MSFNIKACLLRKDGSGHEYRRFTVDPNSVSFRELAGKVASVFSILTPGNFQLLWKDNDGDLISFSTDAELSDALNFNAEAQSLLVFVKENKPESEEKPESSDNDPAVHYGVECDGCGMNPVKGDRHKCMVCPDYDLCGQCKTKGVHDQHSFMCWNRARPWMGFGRGRRGCHRGRGGGWFGRGCQWGPAPPFPQGATPNPPEGASAQTGEQQQQPWWHPFMAYGMGGGGAGGENPQVNEEYLRHMGEQVSAFLEPFGINVDVSVENRENAAEKKDTTASEPTAKDQSAPADAEMKEPESSEKPAEQPPAVTPQPKEGDWTILSENKDMEVETAKKTKQSQPTAPSTDASRISHSLELMMNMGFNNDGGWLTKLLESTNGDIGIALDRLNPKK